MVQIERISISHHLYKVKKIELNRDLQFSNKN